VTQLVLVRHGQTVANVRRVWQGWTEGQLTPLGVQQGEATARDLAAAGEGFDALYSSPLRRAWRTAGILGQALGLSPLAHEGLKEIWFGEIEGLTSDAFAARYPEVHRRWSKKEDLSFTWPGGENRTAFHRRAWGALEEIVTRHEGQSIVVVAHGGTLRAILAHLFPEQLGQWWAYELGNCSLTRVRFTANGRRLLALDDRSHLDGLVGGDT
jgi:probable phosphoglycerate mutase